MYVKNLFIIFVFIVLSSSKCKEKDEKYSLILINKDTNNISKNFQNMKLWYEDDKRAKISTKISKDTMLLVGEHPTSPIDILCLLKNDTCYYQEINIYCSPCAEQMVSSILDDKDYQFKPKDSKNYISKTYPNILFRFGYISETTCSNLRFHKIDKAYKTYK